MEMMKCPACGECDLHAREQLNFGIAVSFQYRCSSCKWVSRFETIEMLLRLGHSIAPGVVYLVELLTMKKPAPAVNDRHYVTWISKDEGQLYKYNGKDAPSYWNGQQWQKSKTKVNT